MQGRDRLDLIALLVQIAETRSLSAAARATGMSQPSASRLLKQLEHLVAAKLVDRTTHEVKLTASGLRFLASAGGLVAKWRQAVEEVQAERERLSGQLRIMAPVAAGQELLARVVARFSRQHPAVAIEFVLGDEAVDPTPHRADLWIRAGELPNDRLVVREVWHIDRAIVAATGHRPVEHPGALADDRAVRLATFVPEAVDLARSDGERFMLRQSAAFLTNDLYAARAAVREGVGYGILPLWSVNAELESGGLVRLCPDWSPPVVVLSLAYPPGRHRPKRLTALIAYVRSELTRDGGLGIEIIEATGARSSIRYAPSPLRR